MVLHHLFGPVGRSPAAVNGSARSCRNRRKRRAAMGPPSGPSPILDVTCRELDSVVAACTTIAASQRRADSDVTLFLIFLKAGNAADRRAAPDALARNQIALLRFKPAKRHDATDITRILGFLIRCGR